MRLSIHLQMVWFQIQVVWLLVDLRFSMLQTCNFENSKTKRFCKTSCKHEALKLKKQSFSARFPSQIKAWNSKTQFFCDSSFKKAWSSKTNLLCEASFNNQLLKFKNSAFLGGFLQKWHVDCTLDVRITICFRDFEVGASQVLILHQKVQPRHENSCNCHANMMPAMYSFRNPKFANIDITKHEAPAPATRKASSGALKSTTPANFFATLTNSSAHRVLCMHLPRETLVNFQRRPQTVSFLRFWHRNRSRATAWCKFCGTQLPKAPGAAIFWRYWLPNPNFGVIYNSRSSAPARFEELTFRASEATKLWKKTSILRHSCPPKSLNLCCETSPLSKIYASTPAGNSQYSWKSGS